MFNAFFYTIGWFWCVLFGIHGHPIVALIGGIFFLILQLYHTKKQDFNLFIQDLLLACFSIPMGILLELFFIHTNLIHYVRGTKGFPPIWIICLYPLFSLLINHSLKWLKKSPLIAFLIGFLAPLSYKGGASLGGLIFPNPLNITWAIIGLSWGVFLLLLTHLARTLQKIKIL